MKSDFVSSSSCGCSRRTLATICAPPLDGEKISANTHRISGKGTPISSIKSNFDSNCLIPDEPSIVPEGDVCRGWSTLRIANASESSIKMSRKDWVGGDCRVGSGLDVLIELGPFGFYREGIVLT